MKKNCPCEMMKSHIVFTFHLKCQLNMLLKITYLLLLKRGKHIFLFNLMSAAILNMWFCFWFAVLSTADMVKIRKGEEVVTPGCDIAVTSYCVLFFLGTFSFIIHLDMLIIHSVLGLVFHSSIKKYKCYSN